MVFRKKLLPLLFCLIAQSAWASSDDFCTPDWTLNPRGYSRCSSLPILAPSNDTRINLKLLLVEDGLGTLRSAPVSKEDADFGYSKVPFSLETFNSKIFLPKDAKDGSVKMDNSVEYGRGSRCDSNEEGKADFIQAVNESKDLSAEEKRLLTEERQKLNPTCVDGPVAKPPATIDPKKESAKRSPVYRQFLHYITAARAFYDSRFEEAGSLFLQLKDSNQRWLKEAARYMVGRTKLNLSQLNAFDPYGFPDLKNVDKKALVEAEAGFQNYLKEYPDGRYASSAKGLLRRVYWLSDQQQKLAEEYQWQLKHPNSPLHNLETNALVQEADAKLFRAADHVQVTNPIFLATIDLALMRFDSGTTGLTNLQKQESSFAGRKALFEYLVAAHFYYVQKDAPGALKKLSDAIPSTMTYLDFSRLVLRGLALEATKDSQGARELWLKLLKVSRQPLQNETLQLALALNYERSREVELAFQSSSPITETEIRAILLRRAASPKLLRKVFHVKSNSLQERYTALYTLLYKDLLLGHYEDFIQDYPLLPRDAAKQKNPSGWEYARKPQLAHFTWSGKKSADSYNCPSALDIAKKLAKKPSDPDGLLCLGDFVKLNDVENTLFFSRNSAKQTADVNSAELGTLPSQFTGKVFSRGEAYSAIIADANAAEDAKAYALYRSIKCYAPSGYNECGGDEVEKSVRKSWFQTLKDRHRTTVWAKALKYYW